jgi:exosortase/archaeosortase family protein
MNKTVSMQIEELISYCKTRLPWTYFWHLSIFIGLFVISRMVLLPMLETSPSPYICRMQDALVGLEAKLIYSTMNIFGLSKSLSGATVTFANDYSLQVLWGCSGIRPLVTTFIIFLFVPGPSGQRFWFIPMALVVMCILVLLHLMILSLFIAQRPGLYDFAHEWITKSMVYGTLFVMWLFWEEIIRRKNTP